MIRTKQLIYAICIGTMSLFANAGEITGNGGDLVVCRKTNGNIASVELLDLYEGSVENSYTYDFGPGDNYMEKAKYVIGKLKNVSPQWEEYLQLNIESFNDEARFLDGIRLIDIPDSDHFFLPKNCALEQVAVHREPRKAGQIRFTIDNELFVKMDSNNKAALIVHEIVYRMLLSYNQTNSISARALVAWMSSVDFTQVTPAHFSDFLNVYYIHKKIKYPGIHLVEGTIVTHENGNVKHALLRSDRESTLVFGGRRVKLLNSSHRYNIQFYPSGEVERFTGQFRGENSDIVQEHLIYGQHVKIKNSDLQFVHLHRNGQPKTLRVSSRDFKILQGGTEFSTFFEMEFYSNGMVKKTMITYRENYPTKIGGQDVKVFKKVEFYPTGEFSMITLAEPTELFVDGTLVFMKHYAKIYFDLAGNITSYEQGIN